MRADRAMTPIGSGRRWSRRALPPAFRTGHPVPFPSDATSTDIRRGSRIAIMFCRLRDQSNFRPIRAAGLVKIAVRADSVFAESTGKGAWQRRAGVP